MNLICERRSVFNATLTSFTELFLESMEWCLVMEHFFLKTGKLQPNVCFKNELFCIGE